MATETRVPKANGNNEEGSVTCAVCEITAAKGVDSWPRAACKICAAKASALKRIKAAGGDSVQAAKDYSAARARGDVCVLKAVPTKRETGEAMPTGVVKTTIRVPQAYIETLLIDPELPALLPLSEDYFERNPHHRELMLNSAFAVLSTVEQHENMLFQFFEKGFAMMEVQIDYGYAG